MERADKVIAVCGGVGGAKLAFGLAHTRKSIELTAVVNVGDDFDHLGLRICPDLDTVTYTLAGAADAERGWGLAEETWRCLAAIESLGGPGWFRLGDADLATHILRRHMLDQGRRLTEIAQIFASARGVKARILPVSDDPIRTIVDTSRGALDFQHYFVRERCEPRVVGLRYAGHDSARPSPEVIAAFDEPALAAIVLCPSNPYLSVDPMLAIAGFRQVLERRRVPLVAVSPIVGGRAVKGPLAKMMGELGRDVSPAGIAAHYGDLVDLWVVDAVDADVPMPAGVRAVARPTVMASAGDRIALAETVLDLARALRRGEVPA